MVLLQLFNEHTNKTKPILSSVEGLQIIDTNRASSVMNCGSRGEGWSRRESRREHARSRRRCARRVGRPKRDAASERDEAKIFYLRESTYSTYSAAPCTPLRVRIILFAVREWNLSLSLSKDRQIRIQDPHWTRTVPRPYLILPVLVLPVVLRTVPGSTTSAGKWYQHTRYVLYVVESQCTRRCHLLLQVSPHY